VPADRLRLPVAVYAVLQEEQRVLMLRRAGTTFRAGQLSLPAGHLDGGEDAVAGLRRELREEVAIEVTADDCRLALLLHSAPEDADDQEYLHLFFVVDHWSGAPSIGEPDKCSELVWVDRRALPVDVVDYVAGALTAMDRGDALLLWGW
jgi:8-oxo-dGTP diphosphatase